MKTADQVQNHRHHNQSGGPSQTLSELTEEQYRPGIGDSYALDFWASAELPFPRALAFLVDIVNQHQEALIARVYLPLQNPSERFAFGWGLRFAASLRLLNGPWRDKAEPYAPLPIEVAVLPGFPQSHFQFTWSCALFAVALALHLQRGAIQRLCRGLDASDAAELAQALRLAEQFAVRDGNATLSPGAFRPAYTGSDAVAFNAVLRAMDRWADQTINPAKYSPEWAQQRRDEARAAWEKEVDELSLESVHLEKELRRARDRAREFSKRLRDINRRLPLIRAEIAALAKPLPRAGKKSPTPRASAAKHH